MQIIIQDFMKFFDFTSTTYFALFLGIVGIVILWFRR